MSELSKEEKPPIIKDLWVHWVAMYPALEFTHELIDDVHAFLITKKSDFLGHFETGLYTGNLEIAFAHADPSNLPRLEALAHITKQEFGEKYWGWPPNEEEG